MVEPDVIADGRAALAAGDWPAVVRALSGVDPAELTGAELEGLADAASASNDLEVAVVAQGHAHARFAEAGDVERAAWSAVSLAVQHSIRGDDVVANAWTRTAGGLLAEAPECPAHALALWAATHQLLRHGDLQAALDTARQARATAQRVGDRNLETVAMQMEGGLLARLGDVTEGVALMDEAMLAAISGQLSPMAFGQIMCQTITVCQHIGDYQRAMQWMEAADRASVIQGLEFSSDCRIHRAGLLKLRGSWARAEVEARIGCEGHPFAPHQGSGWCEIGEIRLQMGDLEGAEEAFAVAYEKGFPPHPGLALLHLAQGDVAAAATSIEQAYLAVGGDIPARARLLDARVRIALAAEDVATARAAAAELSEVAESCGSLAFSASARCAEAWVLLSEGDDQRAAEAFHEGIDSLVAMEMPYEAALSRPGLSRAMSALGDDDGAVLELRAARSTFAQLGAALDEERVVALLGELIGTPPPPATVAEKTFMFTDIERSTLLLEALGDRAWDDLLQWHDRTLREAIGAAGGREVKHEGDGFFAVFETASAALDCAVAIQRGLARHRQEHGFSPLVRIGLHSGSATEREGDYFGIAVNTTARVMSLAAGGEIMATTQVVPEASRAAPPREVRLKGVSDAVSVVSVGWLPEAGT